MRGRMEWGGEREDGVGRGGDEREGEGEREEGVGRVCFNFVQVIILAVIPSETTAAVPDKGNLEGDPMISGKSRIIMPGTLICTASMICTASTVARSFATQLTNILLFKIGFSRKAEDYFLFLHIEICKITGNQIGRAWKLRTKGIRFNNQSKLT